MRDDRQKKKILITGGSGYFGSHTLVEVTRAGHQVVVVDSLINGHAEAIGCVGRLTNTYEWYLANIEIVRA
jgi:UDP-glucose 4-epimerase